MLWMDAHAATSVGSARNQKRPRAKAAGDEAAAAASSDALADTHMVNVDDQTARFISAQQQAVFAVCNSYTDLFLANHDYLVK